MARQTRFRKRKTITHRRGHKSKPFTGITDANLKEIIRLLCSGFMSEDWNHYASSDGGDWGPALGFAANRAEIHNNKIRKMQTICRKELKRRTIKQVNKMLNGQQVAIKYPGPRHES